MSELVDYLASYRKFFEDFAATVNPQDQLPVQVPGYKIFDEELPGSVLHFTNQYLKSKDCPRQLLPSLANIVLDDVKQAIEKFPNDFGYDSECRSYNGLRLMQGVMTHVNAVCASLLDNARLEALPAPRTPAAPLVSTHSAKNSRRIMEDRHVAFDDLDAMFGVESKEVTGLYAVYDGHGGPSAAAYSAVHLHQNLVGSKHYSDNLSAALTDAFLKTDDGFITHCNLERVSGGTTAACVCIRGNNLHAAGAGDSQALLVSRGGKCRPLLPAHRASIRAERKRIEKAGGVLVFWDTWRVDGQLAVTRAIGDASHKPYVTAQPDTVSLQLKGDEDFVVVASDGLWDVLLPEKAAQIVYKALLDAKGPSFGGSQCARELVRASQAACSQDNTSVVVAFLRRPDAVLADHMSDLFEPEVITAPSPLPPECGGVENVGESGEESEDEWNYYAPHNEKNQHKNEEEPSEEDAMSSPLNPDAPAFVPTSADILAGVCGNMEALRDVVAASPQKPLPVLEPPDDDTFTNEAAKRPNELCVSPEHQNGQNGNGSHSDLIADSSSPVDNAVTQFDNDVFLRDLQRVQNDTTNLVDIQVSYGSDVDELAARLRSKESDPMTRSFYGQDDLNAVHRLPSDDDDDLESHKLAYEQVPESLNQKHPEALDEFRQYDEGDEESPLTEKDDFDTEKQYNQSPFLHHDPSMKETSVDVSEESNSPHHDLSTGVETCVDDDPFDNRVNQKGQGDSANIAFDIIPESREVEQENIKNEELNADFGIGNGNKVLETDLDDDINNRQIVHDVVDEDNFVNHHTDNNASPNTEEAEQKFNVQANEYIPLEAAEQTLVERSEKVCENLPIETEKFDNFSEHSNENLVNENTESHFAKINENIGDNFAIENIEQTFDYRSEIVTEHSETPAEKALDDFVERSVDDFVQKNADGFGERNDDYFAERNDDGFVELNVDGISIDTFQQKFCGFNDKIGDNSSVNTTDLNGFEQITNPFGDQYIGAHEEKITGINSDLIEESKPEVPAPIPNEFTQQFIPETVSFNQNYDNQIDFSNSHDYNKLIPEQSNFKEDETIEPFENKFNEQVLHSNQEINISNYDEETRNAEPIIMNGEKDFSLSEPEVVKDKSNAIENMDFINEEAKPNLEIESVYEQVNVDNLEKEVAEERIEESQSESTLTDLDLAPAQNEISHITNEKISLAMDHFEAEVVQKEAIPDLLAQTESVVEKEDLTRFSAPPPTPAETELAQTTAIAAGAVAATAAVAATTVAAVKETPVAAAKKPSTPTSKTPRTPLSAKSAPAKLKTPTPSKPAAPAATKAPISKIGVSKPAGIAAKTTTSAPKTNGVASKTSAVPPKPATTRAPITKPAVTAVKSAPLKTAPPKTTVAPKTLIKTTSLTSAPKPSVPKTTTATTKPAAPRPPITRPPATKPATTASKTTTVAPKPAPPKAAAPRVPLSRPPVKSTVASRIDSGVRAAPSKPAANAAGDKNALTNGHSRPPIRRPTTDAKAGVKDVKQTKEMANKRLTGSKEVKGPIKPPAKPASDVKQEVNATSEA